MRPDDPLYYLAAEEVYAASFAPDTPDAEWDDSPVVVPKDFEPIVDDPWGSAPDPKWF